MTDRIEQAKALGSDARMKVLEWLKEPRRHFAHQESGDPETLGVCVTLIAAKLGMSQPTVSRHLEILLRAGFVTVRRIGRWSYYTRSAAGISDYREWINDNL